MRFMACSTPSLMSLLSDSRITLRVSTTSAVRFLQYFRAIALCSLNWYEAAGRNLKSRLATADRTLVCKVGF